MFVNTLGSHLKSVLSTTVQIKFWHRRFLQFFSKSFSVSIKKSYTKIQIFRDKWFTWFLNYFFVCQICWNSKDWIVRNRQVSAQWAISLNLSSNCACVAFNSVLGGDGSRFSVGSFIGSPSDSSGNKQKLRIACGVLCIVTCSTYLCNKTQTISTLRSIIGKNNTDSAGEE